MMTCEYIAHSGYIFETSSHILLFDIASGVIPQHYLQSTKAKVCFVSHHHSNHFNPNVVSLNIPIIAAADVPLKSSSNIYLVSKQDTLSMHGLHITVFDSTDAGVAFLVDTYEGVIFHAGDCNDWHWKNEVSSEESQLSHLQFKTILVDIARFKIDIACFPCDQRMGTEFDIGPLEFITQCKPLVFCAMHHTLQSAMDDFSKKAFKIHPTIKLFIPKQHNQKIAISAFN